MAGRSSESVGRLIPSHIDASLAQETEDNYRRLSDVIKATSGEFRFLAGAGISKAPPSMMPLSREFQHKCLELLQGQDSPFRVDVERLTSGDLSSRANIEALPLESMLQYLKDVDGPGVLSICDIYKTSPSVRLWNTCHQFLAEWISRHLGPVVTVNIDTLIEDALTRLSGSVPLPVQADMLHMPPRPEVGNLYKLHGTVSDHDTLRMTLDRVNPQLPPRADTFFRSFVGEGPSCFVGWAGADLDLHPIVVQAGQDRSIPRFYVINPGTELHTEQDFRRENRLAFDIIDRVGGFALYVSGEYLFQRLGEDLFGWAPGTEPSSPVAQQRDLWGPLTDWITTRPSDAPKVEYLVGRVTGYVYFHLGLHADAYAIWQKALPLAPSPSARSRLLRDSGHAQFRLHDIGQALRVNSQALREAVSANDEAEQAHTLYGLGSMPTAWPASDLLGFLMAASRLRKAIARYERIRIREESKASDDQSFQWLEATLNEASSYYWLGRWEQRWLGALLPSSKRIRDHLFRIYDQARVLLSDPRANPVNELVNPLRSMALVRVYDNPKEAFEYASEAERLARWSGDRQRLSTVLRDVAETYRLAGSSSVPNALHYWREALLVACEGVALDLGDPARAAPEEVAMSVIGTLSKKPMPVAVADANGISKSLAGLAKTLISVGCAYTQPAFRIATQGSALVLRLPLPLGSRLAHAVSLWAMLPTILLFGALCRIRRIIRRT
jgi:tetratricopeptide (TPR) repeat protein